MFKKKPQAVPAAPDVPEETFHAEYIDIKFGAEDVEAIMDQAMEHFFATPSPNNPQEMLAVLRLEDVYRIVCAQLGVDPKSTKYKAYEND